jgi:hypothetical protein
MVLKVTLTNGDVREIPFGPDSSITVQSQGPDGQPVTAAYGEIAAVETVDDTQEPEPAKAEEPAAVESATTETQPEPVAEKKPRPQRKRTTKPADKA